MVRGRRDRHEEIAALGQVRQRFADAIKLRPEVAPAIAQRLFGRGRRDDMNEGAQHIRNRLDRPD